jgi:hypothetical protein
MSDEDPNDSQSGEEQFYGEKPDLKAEDEEQVLTKGAAHRQKKRPIHKRKEKTSKSSKRACTPPSYPVNTKEKEKEAKLYQFAERKASALIDEMEKRYEKDVELYQKKQLACKKLTFLDELAKQLKNVCISPSRSTSAKSSWSRTGLGCWRSGWGRWQWGRSGRVCSPASR